MPIQLKSDLNREKVMGRNAKVIRKTSETDIEIYFETDGTASRGYLPLYEVSPQEQGTEKA